MNEICLDHQVVIKEICRPRIVDEDATDGCRGWGR